MRIVVTGASGLLGKAIIESLSSNADLEILGLYNTRKPNNDAGINWQQCNVLDYPLIAELTSKADIVIHTAGLVSYEKKDRHALYEVNTIGTSNVVNACLENKVKHLIHISSIAALGKKKAGGIINEATLWVDDKKSSEYGKSKYLGEMEVWRGQAEGLDVSILNPSVIIGPGNWETDSSRIFSVVDSGQKYYSKGRTGYVSVKDIAKTCQYLCEQGPLNERVILNGENLYYKEILSLVAKNLGKKPPQTLATQFMINIAVGLERFSAKINKRTPRLSRELVKNARTDFQYSNKKFKQLINIEQEAIQDAVENTAHHFLKERKTT